MRQTTRSLLSMLLLLILAACGGGAATPTTSPSGIIPPLATVDPTAAAGPPQAGMATIKGRVLTADGSAPLANTIVRFSEVYRQNEEAIFVLDEARSPGGTTDAQGNFVVPNIAAREYVMVVGDVYGVYTVVAEESGKKKVWNAVADQILDTGEVKVELK